MVTLAAVNHVILPTGPPDVVNCSISIRRLPEGAVLNSPPVMVEPVMVEPVTFRTPALLTLNGALPKTALPIHVLPAESTRKASVPMLIVPPRMSPLKMPWSNSACPVRWIRQPDVFATKLSDCMSPRIRAS